MSFLNANSFLDRQAAAAKAKKDMAEKFLSRPKYDPNDPAVLEREAKRREILEGRAAREVERQKRKAEAEAAQRPQSNSSSSSGDDQPSGGSLASDAQLAALREKLAGSA